MPKPKLFAPRQLDKMRVHFPDPRCFVSSPSTEPCHVLWGWRKQRSFPGAGCQLGVLWPLRSSAFYPLAVCSWRKVPSPKHPVWPGAVLNPRSAGGVIGTTATLCISRPLRMLSPTSEGKETPLTITKY